MISTSIGAINASLIAGSRRDRLSRLREFWKPMEQGPLWTFSISSGLQ